MENKININSYVNGIKIEELNCFDRAVAAAAGSYEYSYYYYYSLLCAIEFNWTDFDFWVCYNDLDRWIKRNNRILNYFGLGVKSYDYFSRTQLIDTINNSIKQGEPILVFSPYYAIPWDERYLDETQRRSTHLFLISEYNERNQTYIIRDDYMISQHNEQALKELDPTFNQSLLWRYQVPLQYLIDTLEFSNKIAEKEGLFYSNKLVSIIKTNNIPVKTAKDMSLYLKNFEYFSCTSRLNSFIQGFNVKDELKEVLREKESKFGVFRRNYIGSIIVISKVVSQILNDLKVPEPLHNEFTEIINDICDYRSKLSYKLQRMILKENKLSYDSMKEIQEKIYTLDERLINYIKNI